MLSLGSLTPTGIPARLLFRLEEIDRTCRHQTPEPAKSATARTSLLQPIRRRPLERVVNPQAGQIGIELPTRSRPLIERPNQGKTHLVLGG